MNFEDLYKIIKQRKEAMPKNSYTVSLLKKGDDTILQKIGEEATEVILATKSGKKQEIISEVSDLFYHVLVLLVSKGIAIENVEQELEFRNKIKR